MNWETLLNKRLYKYELSDELVENQKYTISTHTSKKAGVRVKDRVILKDSFNDKNTFTADKSMTNTKELYVSMDSAPEDLTMRLKLERGILATDWTEAPKDLEDHADAGILAERERAVEDAEKKLEEAKKHADAGDLAEKERAVQDAKAKLEEAKKHADAVAVAKANLAEVEAKAHADGIVTKEEKRAIQEAKDKLEEAKKYAKEQDDLMDIGVRNLLLDSAYYLEQDEEGNAIPFDYKYELSSDLEAGREYTFSLEDKHSPARLIVDGVAVGNLIEGVLTFKARRVSQGAIVELVAPNYTKNVKLEQGSKATSWTSAPEDVEEEIGSKADSETVDEIDTRVSETEALTELQSKDIGELATNLQNYREMLEANVVDAETALEEIENLLSREVSYTENLGEFAKEMNFINSQIVYADEGIYIHHVNKATGTTGGTGIRIAHDKIEFMDGGERVAYITGQVLYIDHGIFVETVQIGEHLIETMDGQTIFTWMG